jgi:hypothetical protein
VAQRVVVGLGGVVTIRTSTLGWAWNGTHNINNNNDSNIINNMQMQQGGLNSKFCGWRSIRLVSKFPSWTKKKLFQKA